MLSWGCYACNSYFSVYSRVSLNLNGNRELLFDGITFFSRLYLWIKKDRTIVKVFNLSTSITQHIYQQKRFSPDLRILSYFLSYLKMIKVLKGPLFAFHITYSVDALKRGTFLKFLRTLETCLKKLCLAHTPHSDQWTTPTTIHL